MVFWVVMPNDLVVGYHYFRQPYHCHLQDGHTRPHSVPTYLIMVSFPTFVELRDYYCVTNNNSVLDCILSCLNWVHTFMSYFFKISCNITILCIPRSPKWFLILRFLNHIFVCILHFLNHATCSVHLTLLVELSDIYSAVWMCYLPQCEYETYCDRIATCVIDCEKGMYNGNLWGAGGEKADLVFVFCDNGAVW